MIDAVFVTNPRLFTLKFKEILESNPQYKNRVIILSDISDDHLAYIYSAASVLCVSSLEEGFGLVAVEALACKCEVIVPELQIFKSVLGEHAHYFPTNDSVAFKNLIRLAMSDHLEKRSFNFNASIYSWDKSANIIKSEFIKIFEATHI